MEKDFTVGVRPDNLRVPRGEMEPFRYADGTPMERGDRVSVDGAGGAYRIVGWEPSRGLAMVAGPGDVEHVAPERLGRC